MRQAVHDSLDAAVIASRLTWLGEGQGRTKGNAVEWHCRKSCLELRRGSDQELIVGDFARCGQPVIGFGSAFDCAGFDTVGSVTDTV